MAFSLHKLFLVSTYLGSGGLLAYMALLERKNQALYKHTIIFHSAMEKLKSHPGAIHYLGEPIKDGYLTVVKEEKEEDNSTKYKVKVAVKGSKANGQMVFWLRRKDEDDGVLYRIELYVDKLGKGFLIMNENNLTSTSV